MEAQKLGITDLDQPLDERQKNVLFSEALQAAKNRNEELPGLDRKQVNTWWELFKEFLNALNNQKEALILGSKRTNEVQYLKPLLDKGVKIIYCYRDPRDVLISAKNRFSDYKLFKRIQNWKSNLDVAFFFKEHDNFYMLGYENLMLYKETAAKELTDFLNLPITTDIKSLQFGNNAVYQDNSSFGDVQNLFDSNAVNRWKAYQESSEVYYAEAILKNYLTKLGYPLVVDNKKLLNQCRKKFNQDRRKALFKQRLKKLLAPIFN
jgi:hypothetical protein